VGLHNLPLQSFLGLNITCESFRRDASIFTIFT
jgi:hypothetical protein